jgi:deazaflavin-dependent oxidoreductase (nitroreductase family)
MAPAELEGALQTASEIELTVTGRRSGRDISNPVWFVQEGEKLYLLPVGGSDSDWYQNVLKTPTIRIAAGGAEASAHATPITDRVSAQVRQRAWVRHRVPRDSSTAGSATGARGTRDASRRRSG